MRPGVNGAGFGEARGDYAVAALGGALAQLGRRLLIGLCLVLLVALVYIRPTAAFTKGAITISAALVAIGLRWAWGRASTRFGLRRCYLFRDGLVITGLFGQPRRAVAWADVMGMQMMVSQSLFLAFYRFEIIRRGSRPVAFLALGFQPPLVEPLLSQAAENGVSH
ncbi:hypothetical protein OG413_30140 [Streptomyces sp. NBC_01433]|uniref:hypothetical protein n=1 Tax=Streptomyces sp. NBC_01433 TaxID=2903864 RepID=UPI00225A4AFB|nr:hypothetical protein [Streptomyces sp. NBC_01433]MCX4679496.1 hypothetical protein [Streptomyces sp. NBC_01433]